MFFLHPKSVKRDNFSQIFSEKYCRPHFYFVPLHRSFEEHGEKGLYSGNTNCEKHEPVHKFNFVKIF